MGEIIKRFGIQAVGKQLSAADASFFNVKMDINPTPGKPLIELVAKRGGFTEVPLPAALLLKLFSKSRQVGENVR